MGFMMKRFIDGRHRQPATLLPESLDEFVVEYNLVRVAEHHRERLSAHRYELKKNAEPSTTLSTYREMLDGITTGEEVKP